MSFAQIKDNDALIGKIRTMIKSGNVPHAFIVESPRSVDKTAFATAFAQALLCPVAPGEGCGNCPTCRRIADRNHLDVIFVEATEKKGSKVASVRDEDVEALQERLGSKPLEGDRSVAVICDADSITPRAFNRFLKTLEEPAPGTVILLLSENMESMPSTIRSRCVHLRLNAYGRSGEEGREAADQAAALLDGLLEGRPYYQLREIIEPRAKGRNDALLFVDALEGHCGILLTDGLPATERDRLYRLVAHLEETREEIRRGDRADSALKKMVLSALRK
jgi:DNA polymerase-3 subunit delta'